MECGDYEWRAEMARGPSAVGLHLKFPGVQLALAARVPRQPARAVPLEPPLAARARAHSHVLPADGPFMSDMDEISYWVYTKRAPCLMNYDNLIKKQSEEAQCSKAVIEDPPSPKKRKKKRKLSMLDEESQVSSEKQHNMYFGVSKRTNQPTMHSCKSDSMGSDVDFNIKNTSFEKPKKPRLQKNNRAKIHKKPRLVTSTPKAPVNLRRSLRQAQQGVNNVHLNNSYDVYNNQITNGYGKTNNILDQKVDKVNKPEPFDTGDGYQISDNKKTPIKTKPKAPVHLNGQFEDLSDVSGFTANYIRSTKVQSSKTPKKLRCKSGTDFVKESQQQNDNMVICVNKSMNTGIPRTNVLNCSTDSSQNVLNLITKTSNDKSSKLDKSTSLLKFVDTRSKSKEAIKDNKQKSSLNIAFKPQSGTSRYPKRYKNQTDVTNDNEINSRTRSAHKNCLEYNNSDKKENPDTSVSKTRSGRNISLAALQRENSVLVVSNSTEQVSSMVSMNVARPMLETRKRRTTRQLRSNKLNKSGTSLRKDSLRDKSGFSACFSESDDDSVPLVQRKYFCN